MTGSLASASGFTSSDKLFLGAISSQSNAYNFNGLVDEVQVYDRALSGAEVQSLADPAGGVIPEPTSLFVWSLLGIIGLAARWRRG